MTPLLAADEAQALAQQSAAATASAIFALIIALIVGLAVTIAVVLNRITHEPLRTPVEDQQRTPDPPPLIDPQGLDDTPQTHPPRGPESLDWIPGMTRHAPSRGQLITWHPDPAEMTEPNFPIDPPGEPDVWRKGDNT